MAAFPVAYTAFFLWIEPVFTLLGAAYALLAPDTYLQMTHASSASSILSTPVATLVALRQLGNLYLAFALNEALVLRATSDIRVWRALLLGLLIADFGHLFSLQPLGPGVYYDISNWGPMDWGNVAFVYCGATMRACFLAGVGMTQNAKKAKGRRSIKSVAEETIQVDAPQSPVKAPKSTRGRKKKNAEASST